MHVEEGSAYCFHGWTQFQLRRLLAAKGLRIAAPDPYMPVGIDGSTMATVGCDRDGSANAKDPLGFFCVPIQAAAPKTCNADRAVGWQSTRLAQLRELVIPGRPDRTIPSKEQCMTSAGRDYLDGRQSRYASGKRLISPDMGRLDRVTANLSALVVSPSPDVALIIQCEVKRVVARNCRDAR